MQDCSLEFKQDYWIGRFQAMASPCEILMDLKDESVAKDILNTCSNEAWRIEQKFSRYRDDNLIYKINHSHDEDIEVDDELAGLLDYAEQCYQISDGLFDITSGILREVWRFDGSDRLPSKAQVDALLPRIGWDKLSWHKPFITLQQGMEIDLGGIGKEYAVDRSFQLARQHTSASLLINYGGDLYSSGPRQDGRCWTIGIEDPNQDTSTSIPGSLKNLQLKQGGLATSGDARRFLLKDGVRYSHILDPRTGWPVKDAPHSVTVVAASCTEAGILATLAMLHGEQAEEFLETQGVQHWCIR